MNSTQYDAVVIGAGMAGGFLARALAQAGWKTAIIERVHVGGTCVNEGCSPTKTMIANARVAYLAQRGADYGVVHTGPITIDMSKVRHRKRAIVENFRSFIQESIDTSDGVDLLMGEARFVEPKVLEVRLNGGGVQQITAKTIFINAGDRPAPLVIPGVANVPVLDSTSIMELDQVPEHLLIVGGGYVGLEFGQMFRRFGSEVTIIQRGPQLLRGEDRDVVDEVAKIMREDGLEILLEAKPVSVSRSQDGVISLVIQTKTGERTLTGSHVLAATGRIPNTDWLNLDAAGVLLDESGYIQVNDRLETNVPGIYALGDIKGRPALRHVSDHDFRIIRTNLIEKGNASTRDRLIPYTIFIDPQLGRVGLSETDARAQGRTIKVAKIPMNSVVRALEMDEPRGFIKAVVDAETGQILGAAVLGVEGGEIMSMLELAMMGKLPYTVLHDAIFAHPTLAEALNNLFSSLD